MPKIKVTLNIGFSGAEHEDVLDIDDDEWASCETEEQKEDLRHDYWKEWAWNYIDGSCNLVE